MVKKYVRLTFEERIEIEKLLSHHKSFSEIARVLNRDKSSICREAHRIRKKKYSAMAANWDMVYKSSDRRSCKNKMGQCLKLHNYVLKKLYLRWPPPSDQHKFTKKISR